jgi:hypothetical protein
MIRHGINEKGEIEKNGKECSFRINANTAYA